MGDMRNFVLRSTALGLMVVAGAAPAYADDPAAGTFEAKFEQVANNCDHTLSYAPSGIVKIEVKAGELQVDIERTPVMRGTPRHDGKVSAKSRLGHTPIAGMDGVFSVAGRITAEGMLSLTLIGEYQASGKPLCTQSWTLSGLRAQGEPRPADKPAAKPKH
jgi:hypothetical protein